MSQCEKTKNQTEQNKCHAVAGIEAHPTPPHCCFFRNDRCNLAHADLECGVTGRELWGPERIDEVDYSERKAIACYQKLLTLIANIWEARLPEPTDKSDHCPSG